MKLFEEPKVDVILFSTEQIMNASSAGEEEEPEYDFYPMPCF